MSRSARLARKTKRSQRKRPSPELIGLSPLYMARLKATMELYDDLTTEEAALVGEYGFDRAIVAIRQFYGQPAKAKAFLEAERTALQVLRWKPKR